MAPRTRSPKNRPAEADGSGAALPGPMGAWVLGAFLLLALMIYWPSLGGDFLWDDDDYVSQNMTLRSLGGLGQIWFEIGATPQYYPMVHTTFWVEWRLFNGSPVGFRVVNALLHGANAFLLWLVLRRLRVAGALLAAALFLAHPVAVESVAWITERKNVLSLFFYLLAGWVALPLFGLGGREEREFSPGRYAGFLALYLAALFSKTVACSLPAALLLLVYWRRGRAAGRDWALALPALALGVGLAAITIWMEKVHVGAEGADFDFSVADRFLIAGRAPWFYLGKIVWPAPLSFIYPRWELDPASPLQWLFPLAAAALIALLWWKRTAWGRGPLVAVLMFGGTLVPALGFVDVYPFVFSFVADHFQYHASLALFVLAAALLLRFVPRQQAFLTGFLIAALLAVVSWKRAHVYTNLETLWADTLEKNPESWMPLNNMGLEMARQGRHEEAVGYYERAVAVRPDDALANYNLGTALMEAGRVEESLASFEESFRIEPRRVEARLNKGAALLKLDRPADAAAEFEAALPSLPEDPLLRVNYGKALAQSGRVDKALEQWREAAELAPGGAAPWMEMGLVAMERGRHGEAIGYYREAIARDPGSLPAHVNLANALVKDNRPKEALAIYDAALVLDPKNADCHFNKGVVLMDLRLFAEAIPHFEAALALNPNDREALARLTECRRRAAQ